MFIFGIKHSEAITHKTPFKKEGIKTMKKLKCKKEYGVWYYKKIAPNCYNGLDAPIYELYDENLNLEITCGCYDEMKLYVSTGGLY